MFIKTHATFQRRSDDNPSIAECDRLNAQISLFKSDIAHLRRSEINDHYTGRNTTSTLNSLAESENKRSRRQNVKNANRNRKSSRNRDTRNNVVIIQLKKKIYAFL